MAEKIVRTRFAPSPTGYLHVGGARTALFAWLYARANQGQFILRIEDTDRERSTQASVDAIIDGMQWLGLDYDEGPFFQTKRMDRYKEVIEQLLQEDKAYRCYCSKERLGKLRDTQLANKEKPRYDGCCRDQASRDDSSPYVIRFRNPQTGTVTFRDQIRGEISVANKELDDLIIARTDGSPTYNFTVVVDDADMQITEVIRGDDHINNTPRQINIFKALNLEPPKYAHVPMILGADGKRLSKRHGAVSVLQYRDDGFLAEALLNYLVRLGWAHQDQEIFSREEMIELFAIEQVNRAPAAFNPEKLLWLNQHYMKTLPPKFVAESLAWQLQRLGVDCELGPALEEVVAAQAERSKTLIEMAERSVYFFQEVTEYDPKAARKNLTAEVLPALQEVREQFAALANWEKEPIHEVIVNTAVKYDMKLGKLAQPVRVAVTGNTVSPPIDLTLSLLGREIVLQRLDRACTFISGSTARA